MDKFSKSSRGRRFGGAVKGVALAAAVFAGSVAGSAQAGGHLDATDDVYWFLKLTLAEGQVETFDALMAEMVQATRQEAGAKVYEWFRDGNEVHIVERYETNEDADIHLGNFGANFAERFTAILTPVELNVYGPVEGAVREGLAGFGATFYDQVGGFGD